MLLERKRMTIQRNLRDYIIRSRIWISISISTDRK